MTVTRTSTDYSFQISPLSFSFASEKGSCRSKNKTKTNGSKFKNPRVAHGRDWVQSSKSCDSIIECFGEGTIFSPLETLRKQHTQKMTGENREDSFHEANVIANLESRDIEGITEESGKEFLFSRGANTGFGQEESRVILCDILEGLARIDESGIFSNPVEGPLDTKFSDTNSKCKNFTMIHKKIESQEYLSWKSFVDDFECICNDVMSYYRRDSALWKAANDMLHQGGVYLDQIAKRPNWNFCCFTKTDEQNGDWNSEAFNNRNANLDNAVALGMNQNNIKWNNKIPFCGLPRNASMQSDITNSVQQVETAGNLCVQEDECPLGHQFSNLANASFCSLQELGNCSSTTVMLGSANLSGYGIEVDDTVVDITGPEFIWKGVIINSPGDAMESSSSFGDTDADDYETCGSVESESELHNGNLAATFDENNCSASLNREKRKLSDDWKSYRRGIEWRCHWLELRVKECLSQASKYDCILKNIQSKKMQRESLTCIKDSAARATPLISHSVRQHILHRKPKKVRNEKDLSAYMLQHPLFSLYENRTEADGRLVEDDPADFPVESDLISRMSDASDYNVHLGIAGALDGENAIAMILWSIENLQYRIIKMRHQLKKFVKRISSNNKTHNSWSTQSLKGTLQGPMLDSLSKSKNQVHVRKDSKVQTRSLARRRVSDFDINNVVMPVNSTAVYVEPARHGFIQTPCWRLVGDSKLDQNTEDTSEEATDDEVYIKRHRYMEMMEKYIRSVPNPGKKFPARAHRFGLEITSEPRQTRTGTEDMCTEAPGNELPIPNCYLPWEASIPKRKRSGRRRPSLIRDA